jgi:hypothetical protein
MLRRRLLGYLEGIAIFRTRPKSVYAGFEEEALEIRRFKKKFMNGCSKICGNTRCLNLTASKMSSTR